MRFDDDDENDDAVDDCLACLLALPNRKMYAHICIDIYYRIIQIYS